MLAGVMPPDEGGAIVAGADVVRDPEGAKHHLSYMPQRFGLYEWRRRSIAIGWPSSIGGRWSPWGRHPS
jgi:hypothetical protein